MAGAQFGSLSLIFLLAFVGPSYYLLGYRRNGLLLRGSRYMWTKRRWPAEKNVAAMALLLRLVSGIVDPLWLSR